MRRRVSLLLPRELFELLQQAAADGGYSVSSYIAAAVKEALSRPTELCKPPHAPRGSVYVATYLYERVYRQLAALVKLGIYKSVSDAVRAALAKKLGLPCEPVDFAVVAPPRAVIHHGCGAVNFAGDWERVKAFTACLMRKLLEGARGRVLTFNLRRICGALGAGAKGDCMSPTFALSIYQAVEEVASGCIIERVLSRKAGGKRKSHTLLLDVECLKRALDGHGSR